VDGFGCVKKIKFSFVMSANLFTVKLHLIFMKIYLKEMAY
jgi:hypothetical protein